MLKKWMIAGALATLTLTAGCSRYYRAEQQDDNLISVSQEMVSGLQANLKQPLPVGSLVAVNSFVHVSEPGQYSPLERILTEQVLSSLHHAEYRVIALELPEAAFEKNEVGVIHWTEKTKEALKATGAQALLVGFVAPGKNHAYVSTRLIEVMSQVPIATFDTSLSMGADTKALLAKPSAAQQ